MRVALVVGTRPEFVQSEPLLRALAGRHYRILIHTGQHYDPSMSELMLRSLRIRRPRYTLGVGSGSHAAQTAKIMERLEPILVRERADRVVVFGDTNSTLAAALTASKLGLSLAHVEAGLRSYNRSMPEELNRVVVDHLADLLFCPTRAAVSNLRKEGIRRGVHLVGDVMYDSARYWRREAVLRGIPRRLGLRRKGYSLMTLHRPGNVDEPEGLRRILTAIGGLEWPVLFPVHPRTRARLRRDAGFSPPENLRVIEPLPYLDFLSALIGARNVLTDSGGVQKQAYFFGVPCVTLREETEWVETVASRWNVLVGTGPGAIVQGASRPTPSGRRRAFYGDGRAAERIVGVLEGRAVPRARRPPRRP